MTVAAAFQKGSPGRAGHVSAGARLALRPPRPDPAAARRLHRAALQLLRLGRRRPRPGEGHHHPALPRAQGLLARARPLHRRDGLEADRLDRLHRLDLRSRGQGPRQHRQRRQDARRHASPARSRPRSCRRREGALRLLPLQGQGRSSTRPTARSSTPSAASSSRAIETENRQVYFKNNSGYVVHRRRSSPSPASARSSSLGILDFVWLIVAIVAGVAIGLFTSALPWPLERAGLRAASSASSGSPSSASTRSPTSATGSTGLSFDTGLLAAISIVIITIVFAILLRAPTVQGRKVMDEIEGFKMYLDTAEKNRLNFVDEPPMTVDALRAHPALRHRARRRKALVRALRRRARPQRRPRRRRVTTSPSWYSGRNWSSSSGGFTNTVTSVATGMSAAMIAAQPVAPRAPASPAAAAAAPAAVAAAAAAAAGSRWAIAQQVRGSRVSRAI